MNFEELNLKPELIKALNELNFTLPTQIQEKTIPLILEKKDILALAQTGTGKTAAFALPILNLLLDDNIKTIEKNPKAIILAPTRELANQIYEDVNNYSKYTLLNVQLIHAGLEYEQQENALKNKMDLLIITPNKLLILLQQKMLTLANLQYLVLDEADKIIQTSANADLKEILKLTPFEIQTLLFSATMSPQIQELAKNIQKNHIKIDLKNEPKQQIDQNVLFVIKQNKEKLLLDLLNKKEVKSAIIFTNSKNTADHLVRFLTENQIKSEALHSAKSDTHRTKVINNIKSRKIKYLIATDLAARGLDIDNITHVINYEMPITPESYTHRIGRVGRAEVRGTTFTLCSLDERNYFKKIEQKNKLQMLTHAYHSDVVKNAKAKDAKPKYKQIDHTINKNRLKAKFAKHPKKSNKE